MLPSEQPIWDTAVGKLQGPETAALVRFCFFPFFPAHSQKPNSLSRKDLTIIPEKFVTALETSSLTELELVSASFCRLSPLTLSAVWTETGSRLTSVEILRFPETMLYLWWV
jgi:hypothetical protein